MARPHRRLNSAQFDENYQNRPKLILKRPATSFSSNFENWQGIRYQHINLHPKNAGSTALREKIKGLHLTPFSRLEYSMTHTIHRQP